MNEIKNVTPTMRSGKKQEKRKFTENVYVMMINFIWHLGKLAANLSGTVGNVIIVLSPFLMLYIGEYVYCDRGYWAIGGEVMLPVVLLIIGFALKAYARVSGNDHYDLPVPRHRFTHVDYNSGQVDIENKRLQEMILYMADLEDWFERNGYR
jgi:hypothetical protein